MSPEIARPITELKSEIARNQSKFRNFGSSWPSLVPLNLFQNDFLGPGVAGKSKLDTLTRSGRRGFAI